MSFCESSGGGNANLKGGSAYTSQDGRFALAIGGGVFMLSMFSMMRVAPVVPVARQQPHSKNGL
jgi:hypothetical protein